jgi:ribosomal protein S17E
MNETLSASRKDFVISYQKVFPHYTELQNELFLSYHEQDGNPTKKFREEIFKAYKNVSEQLKNIKNIDDAKNIYRDLNSTITMNHPVQPKDFVSVYIRDYLKKRYGSALDNLLAPIHSEKPTVLPVLEASELNFSQALDDLNNRMSHFYYSRQSNLSEEELSPLGEHYGFKIHPASSKSYGWPEDNLWLSRDGKLAFQPKTPLENKEQYNQFVTALKDKGIPNSEEEGLHSLGIKDSQGLPQRKLDQAKHFLASFNKRMVKTFSIIDGGNMLTGLRENGNPYVLVGRDAVLQTTLVHGGFAQQGQPRLSFYDEVRVNEKLKELPEDVDAINRMTTMLQAGEYISNSLSPEEARDQAKRFLAMNEITQDIMAAELKVPREDLVIISQPGFHIDMYLRPLSDGRVLVNDYEESKKLVERVLNDNSHELINPNSIDFHKIIDFQQIIRKFGALPQYNEKIRALAESIVNDESNRDIHPIRIFLKDMLIKLNALPQYYEKSKALLESILNDDVDRFTTQIETACKKLIKTLNELHQNYERSKNKVAKILKDNASGLTDQSVTLLNQSYYKNKNLVDSVVDTLLKIVNLQKILVNLNELPQYNKKNKDLLNSTQDIETIKFGDQTIVDLKKILNDIKNSIPTHNEFRADIRKIFSNQFTDQKSIVFLKKILFNIYKEKINHDNSYQEIEKELNTVLIDRKIRKDCKESLKFLENLRQKFEPINALIEKQLQNNGLQIIKAPGVFSIGNLKVNYMNGVMGTSPKDEKFYMTNASSIEPLNKAFSEWIKKQQPGLHVEFIGSLYNHNNPYNKDLNTAEYLLRRSGGFDCVTLHHEEASQSSGIRAETADSVVDLRVAINKESQVDGQAVSAKQLFNLEEKEQSKLLLVDAMATFSSNHPGTHSTGNPMDDKTLSMQNPFGNGSVLDTLSRHQRSAGTL